MVKVNDEKQIMSTINQVSDKGQSVLANPTEKYQLAKQDYKACKANVSVKAEIRNFHFSRTLEYLLR